MIWGSRKYEKSPQCCTVCGAEEFAAVDVLWEALIREWQLAPSEVAYINRQQGLYCKNCGNNLRAMTLARAIVNSYGFNGTLDDFCRSSASNGLSVLEINPAGALTKHLNTMRGHRLVTYPEYDMTELDIASGSMDLVVHSDTLEHVSQPERAMAECLRILKPHGRCIFTVPVIVGRMSRSRAGLVNSYHGNADEVGSDLSVQTEFGADFWTLVLRAGFGSCTIHSMEYPAGLAIEARP